MLGLVTNRQHKYVAEYLRKEIEVLKCEVGQLKAEMKKKIDTDAIAECEDCGRLIYAVNGADRGVEAVRDGMGGYFIMDKYACESCEETRLKAKHLAAGLVDAAFADALGLDDEAPEETLYDAEGVVDAGCGGCAADGVLPCGAQKADVDDGK